MTASNFIQAAIENKPADAKDIINDMLSAKAFDALQARKVEIAQSLYRGESESQPDSDEQIETETETDIQQ